MARRGRRRSAAGAAVLLAVLVAGCSDRRDPGAPRSAADDGGRSSADAVVYPFDELLGFGGSAAELHDRIAEAALGYADEVTRCVRERGYESFVEAPEPTPSVEDLRAFARPAPAASELDHGYGAAEAVDLAIASALADDGPPEELLPFYAAMTPGARDTFLRSTADCFDTARAHHPDPRTYSGPATAYEEIQGARAAIRSSPEALAVWSAWSGCMEDRGHRAPTRDAIAEELNAAASGLVDEVDQVARAADGPVPADAPGLDRIRRGLEDLRRREDAVVADDRACAEPLDLDRRLHELQVRMEGEYLDEHGDELRRLIIGDRTP